MYLIDFDRSIIEHNDQFCLIERSSQMSATSAPVRLRDVMTPHSQDGAE
jgi:hypothetical protein